MPNLKAVGARAKEMFGQGQDMEAVVTFLRENGCSMGTSTWVLEDDFGWTHADAKRFLIESRAWSDLYETNMKLDEELTKYFRK